MSILLHFCSALQFSASYQIHSQAAFLFFLLLFLTQGSLLRGVQKMLLKKNSARCNMGHVA